MSLLLWTSDPRPPPLSYETPSLFLQIIFYSARMLNLTKSSHVAVTHWNVAMCCSYLHYVLLSSMGMTVNLLRYLEQKYKFIKCSTRKLWCSSTWFYKKKKYILRPSVCVFCLGVNRCLRRAMKQFKKILSHNRRPSNFALSHDFQNSQLTVLTASCDSVKE